MFTNHPKMVRDDGQSKRQEVEIFWVVQRSCRGRAEEYRGRAGSKIEETKAERAARVVPGMARVVPKTQEKNGFYES